MIEWLSGNYGVSINVVVFKYIKTKRGDELLARTMIIPEETESERIKEHKRKIPMSDKPGTYGAEELYELLKQYLSEDRATPRRIRDILLPLCLEHETVTRNMIKKELVDKGDADEEGMAGIILTTISRELGIKQRDYLRQIIRYDKVGGEKENYRIEEQYKEIVRRLVEELKTNKNGE
ncbi:MAG TPA: hypothetical protein EYP22_06950 [Methanosarcinales archaeon]|nr:hypothetical protein [Methanosarcinales archaeon]